MSRFRKRSGVTLIELIVVIALLGITGSIVPTTINILNRSHAMTVDEYELQSQMRLTSAKVSDFIRYSQAVFALTDEFVEDTTKMDPEWVYISVSPDKKSIVRYSYDSDSDTHIPEVLVTPQENIEYEIIFEKKSEQTVVEGGVTRIINDNVLFFNIQAFIVSEDEEGNTIRTANKVVYSTELMATNALQVVDKGTVSSPGNVLAYRKDDNTYGEGRSHVVKVSLILDRSGSMDWNPGYNGYYYSSLGRRINFLKEALIGPGLDGTSGIIAQFAAYPNFEINIVPFSTRASYIINDDRSVPFFNAKLEKAEIVQRINGLSASGNTNTGDGIRLSFYNMKDFDTTGYSENVEEHDFTIILVDGESNHYSWVYRDGYNRYYHRWDDDSYYDEADNSLGHTYVERLGETILTEFNYEGEYYLIGYVTNPDSYGVRTIKESLNIPDDQVFIYDDENFDLSEVFSNIATDIMAKTWLVTGPEIRE